MIIKKFVPLILVTLALFTSVKSQEKTNVSALREAALRSANDFQGLNERLMRIAQQRNWPLYITLKQGNRAVLYGINRKGMPLYVTTYNNIISAATIGTTQLWPGGSTGLNLNGSTPGLKGRIAIWDGGRVLGTHQELNGRVRQIDNPPALNDHSTHVSGTLIAAGVNPAAKGMSFGALQLKAYDFNNHIAEMFGAADSLVISNHSYGELAGWNYNTDKSRWEFLGDPGDTVDYKFGYYSSEAQAWDSMSYNAPNYLIVKSVGNNRDVNGPDVGQPYYRYDKNGNMVSAGNRPAGISSNNGYDVVPTYGVSKNIISIGAVNPIPGGYTSPSDVVLSDFSSWGPSDDGRIKPDLVADGINVLSSISTSNNAYAIYSGTSMSSPAAAGSAFLLQEYYYKLHNGNFMRSATLKGILIHTADEAGTSDGPDYQYGYGLIDMPKAASVITSNNTDQLIQENKLTTAAGTFSLTVIASGKGPLTVTICWTDPPGTVDEVNILNNPAPKLVNDLDLRVTGNSTTYMPWILNRLIPWNPATHGDDNLNNVEKIQIPNAVPGMSYTITVTHKGTLQSGAQAYSLIVSGVGSSAYCSSASLANTGTQIDQVTISNIDVTSPSVCSSYTDNTSQTVNLQSNTTYPFTIKLHNCSGSTASRVVKIFIDYNNNGTFTDPGETAVTSPVLAGGTTTYSGNLVVPAGMQVGNITRMRVIAEETTDNNAVLPCGNYALGETEDYGVSFQTPSKDVSVSALVNPLPGTCQSDSQYVSIRIRNNGTVDQFNVPIHLKVISGASTLVDITTVYPDTVASLGSAIFTFQTPFHSISGTTYIIQSGTSLSGDQDAANDAITDTVLISAGSEIVNGTAEICSTNPPSVGLKADTHDLSDAALWFDSPTSTTPIATGVKAKTTTLPSNQTYYLGLNEMTGTVGPTNKMAFAKGGYNYFYQGNFIRIHNDVPLTISTARLYVGAGGKVNFILADLANYDSCAGSFSYFPIANSLIDVYPTTTNPDRVASSINSPLDTGAIFNIDLAIPTPGDHIIIVIGQDSAFLFRNNNITTKPYPMGMPGIFTITGNSAIDQNNCADTAFYQQYYYFLYDMRITLDKCASPRVPVVASTPTPAFITQQGNILKSNYPTGNQWYYQDTLIAGIAGQKDTISIRGPGTYKDVISDSANCDLVATYDVAPGAGIGLKVTPNPNDGKFEVEFYIPAATNTDMRIVDINGQSVYHESYPNFKGFYSKRIVLGPISASMYVVQVEVGGKKYVKKFVVTKHSPE
jgi:hypothetical protein